MKGYKKTRNAAAFFDVDESFLTKGIGTYFIIGIHAFRPPEAKLLRWDMLALEKWFRDSGREDVDDLVSKMLP